MTIKEKRDLGLKGFSNKLISQCESIIEEFDLKNKNKEEVNTFLDDYPVKMYYVIGQLLEMKID